jgi:hypothetical protein
MDEPYFSFSTNRKSFTLDFVSDDTDDTDDTDLAPEHEEPEAEQPSRGPIKLMIVYQVYDSWFFFVNSKGESPVFDNWSDARLAMGHVWHVLKGTYLPLMGHERQTVAASGFRQAAIVEIPPLKG